MGIGTAHGQVPKQFSEIIAQSYCTAMTTVHSFNHLLSLSVELSSVRAYRGRPSEGQAAPLLFDVSYRLREKRSLAMKKSKPPSPKPEAPIKPLTAISTTSGSFSIDAPCRKTKSNSTTNDQMRSEERRV